MSLGSATVEFVPLRNDLANLPQSLAGMLMTANIPVQNAVVELQIPASKENRNQSLPLNKRTRYLGWTGLTSAKSGTIEMDPTFASTLGISHGVTVKISVSAQAPLAHSIYLEPMTTGDWEIVETHVAFLETYMINQVRAVCEGQAITVFPSSTAIATLRVTKIVPPASSVARVSPNSEVIVAPKTIADQDKHASENVSAQKAVPSSATETVAVKTRVSVFPYVPGLETRDLVIKGTLPGIQSGSEVYVSLVTPPSIASASSGAGAGEEAEFLRAKQVLATFEKSPVVCNGISYGLGCALGIQGDFGIGAQVYVKTIPAALKPKSSIAATLHPYVISTSKQLSTKSHQLSSEEIAKLGLSFAGKGLVVPPLDPFLPNGGILISDSKEWGKLSKVTLGQETVLADSKKILSIGDLQKANEEHLTHKVVGQDTLLNKLEQNLLTSSGVLLYGSRGSGKTAIIESVLSRLKTKHVRPLFFKCGTFAQKALPTVRDALKKMSLEAQWVAPCVVVFDNIDKLIPAQQEQSNDSARQQQLAEMFRNIWSPLIAKGNISLVASAQDQADVHAYLLSSHLLDRVVHLKSPEKDLREEILRSALKYVGLTPAEELDYIEVVSATEGYQPCDLWTVVERLSSIMALRESEGSVESKDGVSSVTTEVFLSATTDFTPASLRGVKLERPNVKWNDIGGLETTKKVVLETLEWPTKYAPIFANCPLRLRSGLLLYGYPGCGKTMLASAIASRTGLNFISVKGPEILNKYIGASEQSVRDLFDRAQAAKPCVLFFDEFDSIAPKRGHDATGVTDRVVNQLLTQMDGAEGLDGVYVLAATSRPDMIDSALLRPGRLDKSLLCGLPNVEDRYDIMMRASKTLNVAPEVDFRSIAESTANFSGADLQALVYSAYLNAVHEVLDKQKAKEGEKADQAYTADEHTLKGFQLGPGDLEASKKYITNDILNQPRNEESSRPESDFSPQNIVSNIVIGLKDVEKALSASKPSISLQELNRFKAIYAEFATDRNGEMPPGVSSTDIGARVTLQ